MSKDIKAIIAQMDVAKQNFENMLDIECQKVLVEVFLYWAKRFPKRRLNVVFGMGTMSWDSPGLDMYTLLDDNRKNYCVWREAHEELLKPLLDFVELFDHISANNMPPCPYDFLYNPHTKTIEFGTRVLCAITGKRRGLAEERRTLDLAFDMLKVEWFTDPKHPHRSMRGLINTKKYRALCAKGRELNV